jgi:hypothetical protein
MYHAIVDDPFFDTLFLTAFATAGAFLAGMVAGELKRANLRPVPVLGPFLAAWFWVFLVCASQAMQGALSK